MAEVTLPGFVDLHVHLREPSPKNHAENYESGTRAAALGGYVLIMDMPNTPGHETWFVDRVEEKHQLTQLKGLIPVGVYAGSQPESRNVGSIGPMLQAGAMGEKFYMAPTTNNPNDYEPEDFDDAMYEHAKADLDKPVVVHPGNDNLERMVGRVIQDFGLKIHAAHVENEDQVDIIVAAKKRYGKEMATSEVTGHHLLLTSHDPLSYGWLARMQPPLAEQRVAEKLLERLASGDIDVIATDHAPHYLQSKLETEHANPSGDASDHSKTCYGVGGVEFTPRLMFNLVRMGHISMDRVVDAMSTRPAEIIGAKFGKKTFSRWNMDVVDVISPEDVQSGAGWSPYVGRIATGQLLELSIGGTKIINETRLTQARQGTAFIRRGQVV